MTQETSPRSRDDIRTLCYGAVRARGVPDPAVERLIDHLLDLDARDVRLGRDTSVWHEYAALNGHPCNCARCRRVPA